MAHNPTVAVQRLAILQRLFPAGVPSLWCPSLTHYDHDGRIDAARIRAHLRHLAPHVKGFLIPGSTSDGWELSDAEFWEVLELALDQAQKLELDLLVGVLKADANEALATVPKVLAHISDGALHFTFFPGRRDMTSAGNEAILASEGEEARARSLASAPGSRGRAAAGRQCPIGCVWGSVFPMDVAAAEHSGWPNPLALTPFVMS